MEPGYIGLYRSGELERRAQALEARLVSCDICPRDCGVNRLQNELGYCHSGRLPVVSAVCAHHGEEPAISGSRGFVTVGIIQYMPMHRATEIPLLSRKITAEEHEKVLRLLDELGIENGWVQEPESPEEYLPDFEREGHPFHPANSGESTQIKPATE